MVLVGHSGSGKTTLVEALAQTAGAVNRAGRVEDGSTVSDHDGIEQRSQRSVQLSLVPVAWGGVRINLLDTPGYADFVGELRAGLRAADAALFVVSAAQEAETVADPLLPLAIEAHGKADEDKLSEGLARLVAEDPTMRLEQNQDTHQMVL